MILVGDRWMNLLKALPMPMTRTVWSVGNGVFLLWLLGCGAESLDDACGFYFLGILEQELGCLTDAGKCPEKMLHQPAFLEREIAKRVAAKMTILAFVQQESESLEFKGPHINLCPLGEAEQKAIVVPRAQFERD